MTSGSTLARKVPAWPDNVRASRGQWPSECWFDRVGGRRDETGVLGVLGDVAGLQTGPQAALEFQPHDHSEAEILRPCSRGRSTGQDGVYRSCNVRGGDVLREVEELTERHLVYLFH